MPRANTEYLGSDEFFTYFKMLISLIADSVVRG